MTVTDSTISGNSALGVSGGGIAKLWHPDGHGSTISDNSAGGYGGGIWGSGTALLPARSAAIRRVAMAVASGRIFRYR